MAKVIYMDDLSTDPPTRIAMFSVDAREVLRQKNPRYRTSTNQGAAVVAGQAGPVPLEKPEERLSHVDVRSAPRAGVRGGDLAAGGVPGAPAPATPVAGDPGLDSVVPQGPAAVPGQLVPGAAAVSDELTHAQPVVPAPAATPDEGQGSGFLG